MDNENIKVMLIDDDPNILQILKDFLVLQNLETVAFESPLKALEALLTTNVKLVLLDVNMPEMEGLEVLKRIKKLTPSTQVIMVTGQGDMDIAKQCLESGATDYITKPIDLDYLENSVLIDLLMNF